MPQTAFILGTPWTEYFFDDDLCNLGHFVESYYNHGELAFPPVILSVVPVPDSTRVAVTFANRYEVKQ